MEEEIKILEKIDNNGIIVIKTKSKKKRKAIQHRILEHLKELGEDLKVMILFLDLNEDIQSIPLITLRQMIKDLERFEEDKPTIFH